MSGVGILGTVLSVTAGHWWSWQTSDR